MTDIVIGEDEEPVKEFAHIFERGENGVPQTIKTGDRAHPPIEEAADLFEVPEDELSWILTREIEVEGSVSAASVPCEECDDPVWTTRQRAAEIRHSSITTTCGRCAMDRDSPDTRTKGESGSISNSEEQ